MGDFVEEGDGDAGEQVEPGFEVESVSSQVHFSFGEEEGGEAGEFELVEVGEPALEAEGGSEPLEAEAGGYGGGGFLQESGEGAEKGDAVEFGVVHLEGTVAFEAPEVLGVSSGVELEGQGAVLSV